MGNGIFLGEALLPLNELKLGGIDERLENLEQRQLPLTRPTCYGELKIIDINLLHYIKRPHYINLI